MRIAETITENYLWVYTGRSWSKIAPRFGLLYGWFWTSRVLWTG